MNGVVHIGWCIYCHVFRRLTYIIQKHSGKVWGACRKCA